MTAPVITEAQLPELLSLPETIDALEVALVREVNHEAVNITKTMATWSPASSAHAVGGADFTERLVAFKTWVNTPKGAEAILTLFDSDAGALIAVIEATLLGSLRTAGISGLATRCLADPDADELAIVGTGRQALRQVLAVAAVRRLRMVRVWSPTADNREAMAREIGEVTGIATVATSTLAEAVRHAPIVTLITRAREPFLELGLLARGAHLNAVGAVLPANAEFAPELLAEADVVAVDNLDNAKRGSRELREYYSEDFSGVSSLGELLQTGWSRAPATRLTVFKGMGMGLSDLAAATVVARKTLGRT